jgi:hypothetical protein
VMGLKQGISCRGKEERRGAPREVVFSRKGAKGAKADLPQA